MSRKQLDVMMKYCAEWQIATEVERMKFARHMRGREYGYDEVRDAFCWFVVGFNTR